MQAENQLIRTAILEQGTTAHQRRIVADLKTLPEKAKQANIQTPAIIVVGTVCTLAEQFAWPKNVLWDKAASL